MIAAWLTVDVESQDVVGRPPVVTSSEKVSPVPTGDGTVGAAADSNLVTSAPREGTPQFRQRLLDGMAGAIRELGYFDTKIEDIVRYAYTSKRTFYEYFPNKEACFLALHVQLNNELAQAIEAAVDGHAELSVQVRQAIMAWLTRVEAAPEIELSWIRAMPVLGADGHRMYREMFEELISLVQNLTKSAELRAAGVEPASRQRAIMLIGGLYELVAVTLEEGGDIGAIAETAIDCTLAILSTRH